jgi:heptaprenyl diphosphate synthase/octaprenyl-diphosphate synthase
MSLADIYRPVKTDLDKVEQGLKEIATTAVPPLSELLTYTLQNGGKRLRPALTLLAGKFGRYDAPRLITMATAIELLHTATLVHDDIVDKSALRRGKPTVSRAWGENTALLLGDYLFAKAGRLAATTGNIRVVELFSETLMTISAGELKQARATFDPRQARKEYFDWITSKTACLFAAATESGAILAKSPEGTITALREYGVNFGIAFQIVDDVLDFVGEETELGKPVGSDLSEGIATLPSILFVESHPDDSTVKDIVAGRRTEAVGAAIEKVRSSSAIHQCLDIASDFIARACRAIEPLPENSAKHSLVELARYIISRRK